MGDLSRALTQVAGEEDPIRRIKIVKTAVADSVRLSDSTVDITFTDYFNHSAVPDLVLEWPRTNTQRLLYLRGTTRLGLITDGLPFLTGTDPLIVTLGTLFTNEEPAQSRECVEEAIVDRNAWVTDVDALDTLNEDHRSRPAATTLLSHALIEGGRGLTSAGRMSALMANNIRGFNGAAATDETATRESLQDLNSALSSQQAARMSRVLRAVWEGNGGSPSLFPLSESHGPLTDDDLHFLLSNLQVDDDAFWANLGRSIRAEQIARLHVHDYNENLQHLLTANLQHIRIKGLRVVKEPAYLGEPPENPRWIADGRLSLRGDGWRAYIAARKSEELPAPDESGRPIPLKVLQARAEASQAQVTQVELGDAERALIYESRDGTEVLDDQPLIERAAGVFSDAIKAATILPPGGGSARVDFESASVIGQTNSSFTAESLIKTSLLLLLELTEEERFALQDFLPQRHSPALFEEDPTA